MEALKRLAREIHRRSVWQVMGVYALGGWFAFEIVQSLTEGLGLPEWFPGLAFVLLIIGLPMVLATAIVQEGLGGPQPPPLGLADVGDLPPTEPTALTMLFTWKNAIGGGVLAFALWGVIAAGWLLFGPGTLGMTNASSVGADARKSIAVLPFTSVRSDEDSESFRVGLHDELLTQLFKVGDLRVTSRTSVLEYEGNAPNVRQIGEELGVGALVEGSVQREGETVRINVQLIDTATDEHLWAETYTRRLSAANIIRMQGEVVRDIARTLHAVLSPSEERRLADVPTESLEAYDHYLRGRAREVTRAHADLFEAARMYERAIALDTAFALAHVRLGIVHNALHWFGADQTEERLARSLASIERAFELRPGLPDAHLALARHYYQGRGDFERALSELQMAEAGQVADAELYTVRGAIERRTGRLDQAVLSWTRALETDPRSAGLSWDIANTLTALRQYEEADRYYDRALELAPGEWTQYRRRAWNRIAWTGDLEEARRIMAGGEAMVDEASAAERAWHWYEQALLDRDPEEALRHVLDLETEWIPVQFGAVSRSSLIGEAYWRLGQAERARVHFEAARGALEARQAAEPNDPFVMQALAWVLARSGDNDEALRLGRMAVELLPPSRDAWLAPDLLRDLAALYSIVGEHEGAIGVLEGLMAGPARSVSPHVLAIDPVWDPLRDLPRFRALVAET